MEGCSPISSQVTLSQNVNILLKNKNAPKALKHKINIIFFVTWVFPQGGRGRGGVSQSGNFSHVFPFLVLRASLTLCSNGGDVTWSVRY